MGTVQSQFHKTLVWTAGLATLLALAAVGCGDSNDPTPAPSAATTAGPPATSALVSPTEVPTPTPSLALALTSTPAATADATPTSTPEPSPTPVFDEQRKAGAYDGVTFVVGEGSEATFSVGEQLVRLPLPSDAVMRTTSLSGDVHLDGRPSIIKIDLHRLSSDQNFRDRFIRNRMFGGHRFATFSLGDAGELPGGFTRGAVETFSVTGQLEIRGIELPLSLEIEARDDGDAINILGRTTFTWDEFQIPIPLARPVVSIEDEVRVEVLLVVRPVLAPSP